ncbi:hypothetical protein ABKV19_003194 [Rosa sericea]
MKSCQRLILFIVDIFLVLQFSPGAREKKRVFYMPFGLVQRLKKFGDLLPLIVQWAEDLAARNDAIFNYKLFSPHFLYAQALNLQQEFQEQHLQSCCSARRPAAQVRWTWPSFPFMKLNVDGAINNELGLWGLGAVLRNENGDLMLAVSKGMKGGFSVKLRNYIYAAVLGFQTIIQTGFQSTHIILEMDALGVINIALNATDVDLSIEGALIEEVRNLYHFFSSVICTYRPRKCNHVAHSIAKKALLFSAFQVWVEEGPQWLSDVLISDVSI